MKDEGCASRAEQGPACEDAGFFIRLFRRKVQLTPAQYRKRFGSLRRAVQSGQREIVSR